MSAPPSLVPKPEIIDAPLLRVPLESLKRAAKERKAVVDEAGEALGRAASAPGSSQAAQVAALDALVSQLQGLKRKLGDVSRQEADDAARVKARLEHLQLLGSPGRGSVVAWNKGRLGRILVDHMLRAGNMQAAARLAQETGSEALCELHVFTEVAPVVAGLRGRDVRPALAWCAQHRSRLRKAKSSLEFRLHLQQFVEAVRQGRRLEAVHYARTHLAPWAGQHMRELQRALGSLAFGPDTKVAPYAALFAESRWHSLGELFHRELYRLHALLPESLLAVHLQAGLVALKNPASGSSSSREDPLHHPDFQALAAGLPYAKHVHSKLVCAVTREIMSDANPPMVLPNGYVYSQRGIELLAARNAGAIVCPRTGGTFSFGEARRAFIV